jgi:CRISPR/Cas system-associated endonuclease Cas3-HD
MPCYSFVNEKWLNHSKDVAEQLLRDERLRIAAKRTSIILKSEGLDIDYSLLKEATVIGGALHDIGKTLTTYQKGDLTSFTGHDQAGAVVLTYFLMNDQDFGGRFLELTGNEPITKGHIVENGLDALIITTFSAVLMHHYAYRREYLDWRLPKIAGCHEAYYEIAPECLDDINALLNWLMEVITNDIPRQLVQRLRNDLVNEILINCDIKRRVETLYRRINHRPVVMDVISNAISTFLEVAIASVNIADSNSASKSRRGA